MDRQLHENDRRIFLFILTGNNEVLPKLAKRTNETTKVPAFISSWKPETLDDKSRSGGNGPANPGMNEGRAWKREHENGSFESRSDRIEEFAKRAGYFRLLSNKQKKPINPRQSPEHRDMTAGERAGNPHPNIGPDMRYQ